MSEDISTSFKSISHPIRVQILLILAEQLNNGYQFSDLSRELRIESSGKLSFHLEKLEDLLDQQDGKYVLNEKGAKAVEAIKILGVRGKDEEPMDRPMVETLDGKPETVEDSSPELDPGSPDYMSYVLTLVSSLLVFGLIIPYGIGSFLAEQASEDPNSYILPSIALFSICVGVIVNAIVRDKKNHYPIHRLSDLIIMGIIVVYLPLQVFGVGARTILAYSSEFTNRATFYVLIYLLFVGLGLVIAVILNPQRSNTHHAVRYVFGDKWYAVLFIILSSILSIPFYIEEITASDGHSTVFTYADSSIVGEAGLNGLIIGLLFVLVLGMLTDAVYKAKPEHIAVVFSLIAIIEFYQVISRRVDDGINPADHWLFYIFYMLSRITYVIGGVIGTSAAKDTLKKQKDKKE